MTRTRQAQREPTAEASGRRTGWLAAGAVAAIVIIVLAVVLGPRPLALPERQTGDAELAAQVRQALGSPAGTHAIAVAVVEGDQIRVAGLGDSGDPSRPQVDADSAFEIGSVAKTLTGMLLADMSSDGVVSLDTRVREVVTDGAVASSALGDITLEELAQHRSGLPRVALGGPLGFMRSFALDFAGNDPYPNWSAAELLHHAARQSTDGRGEFAYSNLGAAVLGHSLAAAADTDYPALLGQRLLEPLGMTSTTIASTTARVPEQHVRGTGFTGQPREPWTGAGYAPSGSAVWSTPGDMARLLQAVLDGSAPGIGAVEPDASIGEGDQIGLGWFTTRINGRDVTSHNGGTGGFSSWVGFDSEADRGVAVLSASDRDVDELGERLLGVAPPPAEQEPSGLDLRGVVALAMIALAVLVAVSGARRARAGRIPYRIDLIGGVATVVVFLAVAWLRGPWLDIPWPMWSAGAAIAGVAVVAQAWYTRHRPWRAPGWRPVAGAVINLIIAAVFVAALL